MNYLNLAQIKKHLNIDAEFTDDDLYLESLCDVAEQMVSRHLENDLSNLEKDGQLPAPIIHACLLLVGNLYMNRESVSNINMVKIPNAYEYLLATYKNRTNFST